MFLLENLRTKKAGLITKVILFILITYLAIALWTVRGEIADTRVQVEEVSQQVADQIQENTALANAVEDSSDPERIKDVAREKLDLVEPNERVFYITD